MIKYFILVPVLMLVSCGEAEMKPPDLSPVSGILEVMSEPEKTEGVASYAGENAFEIQEGEVITIRILEPATHTGRQGKVVRFDLERQNELFSAKSGDRFYFQTPRHAIRDEMNEIDVSAFIYIELVRP